MKFKKWNGFKKNQKAEPVVDENSINEKNAAEGNSIDEKNAAEENSIDEANTTEEKDKKEKSVLKENKKKKKKPTKKKWIVVGAVVLAAVIGCGIYFGTSGGNGSRKVYVQKVADIMNLGSGNGGQNRYAGVVESQDVWNITQNADKTVKEVYVEEGDTVKVGDKLFAYDNEEAQLNLAQAKLELERMENEIKAGEAEIKNLENEKKQVSSSDQIEYTIQIQSQKAANKKTEYEIKSQKTKIESLEKAAKNSVVKSEMAGVVQKINQSAISSGADVDEYTDGDDSVFMSILATGDYRIKASVNEQNQWTIEDGKAVIVRSRVDDNVSWTGSITTKDTSNPESASSNEYSDGTGSDDTTTSSKYNFYVALDNSEGLILGQHVYVETDEGQDTKKEGIWLDSYYLLQEDNSSEESTGEEVSEQTEAYVWAEGTFGRLEKRKVTLGSYDEMLDQYEIVEGLTEDDYIAFPEEDLKSGMKTTKNVEEALAEEDTEMSEENMGEDGDYIDQDIDMMDDGMMDDGVSDVEDSDVFQDYDTEDAGTLEDIINEDGTVGSLEDGEEVLL